MVLAAFCHVAVRGVEALGVERGVAHQTVGLREGPSLQSAQERAADPADRIGPDIKRA